MDLTSRPWLRAGVATVGIAATLTGCGPATHTANMPITTVAGARTDGPQLDSPLAPYMLTWRELAQVNNARRARLSACLATLGVRVELVRPAVEIERARAQEAVDLSRLYGITDRESAARNGYWPPAAPAATPPPISGASESQIRRCVAVADKEVHRQPGHSPYGRARELLILSRSKLEHQPAAKKAIAKWVACMASRGHSVTSPLSDDGDIKRELQARERRERAGRLGPSRAEVRLAMDDIACKELTSLVPRLTRVARALDEQLLVRHRRELVLSRQRLDAIVRAATRATD